jgi:hypothetical protein
MWRDLKLWMEQLGVEGHPIELAKHSGLPQPIQTLMEGALIKQVKLSPSITQKHNATLKIGDRVRSRGRWRHGQVGVIAEIQSSGYIVQFKNDRFLFDSYELEVVNE